MIKQIHCKARFVKFLSKPLLDCGFANFDAFQDAYVPYRNTCKPHLWFSARNPLASGFPTIDDIRAHCVAATRSSSFCWFHWQLVDGELVESWDVLIYLTQIAHIEYLLDDLAQWPVTPSIAKILTGSHAIDVALIDEGRQYSGRTLELYLYLKIQCSSALRGRFHTLRATTAQSPAVMLVETLARCMEQEANDQFVQVPNTKADVNHFLAAWDRRISSVGSEVDDHVRAFGLNAEKWFRLRR